MANLTIHRKQVIDDRYIYWFDKCKSAVEAYLHIMTLNAHKMVFQVVEHKGEMQVSWVTSDVILPDAKVVFKTPENYDWCIHYMVLVSWAAMRLTLWERQVNK